MRVFVGQCALVPLLDIVEDLHVSVGHVRVDLVARSLELADLHLHVLAVRCMLRVHIPQHLEFLTQNYRTV